MNEYQSHTKSACYFTKVRILLYLQEPLEELDLQELLVTQDFLERPVTRVQLVRLVLRVVLDNKVRKGHKVIKVSREPLVQQELLVFRVLRA
jgi:hypothetical protein